MEERDLEHDLDARLMGRIQRDETAAFGELYDRHAPRLYALATAICRGRAEDITQEAFLDLWRSRARFDPQRGTVRAWLNQVTRNRAIDALRVERRQREADQSIRAERPREPVVDDTFEVARARDQAAALHARVDALPAGQRQVVGLCFYRGLSQRETARALDLPLGTVKGRSRLALDRLRSGFDGAPAS